MQVPVEFAPGRLLTFLGITDCPLPTFLVGIDPLLERVYTTAAQFWIWLGSAMLGFSGCRQLHRYTLDAALLRAGCAKWSVRMLTERLRPGCGDSELVI